MQFLRFLNQQTVTSRAVAILHYFCETAEAQLAAIKWSDWMRQNLQNIWAPFSKQILYKFINILLMVLKRQDQVVKFLTTKLFNMEDSKKKKIELWSLLAVL